MIWLLYHVTTEKCNSLKLNKSIDFLICLHTSRIDVLLCGTQTNIIEAENKTNNPSYQQASDDNYWSSYLHIGHLADAFIQLTWFIHTFTLTAESTTQGDSQLVSSSQGEASCSGTPRHSWTSNFAVKSSIPANNYQPNRSTSWAQLTWVTCVSVAVCVLLHPAAVCRPGLWPCCRPGLWPCCRP